MKEVKVKWFGYMEPIDEDINTFLAMNEIYEEDIIDIKYSVCHDDETGSYPTALLIYRDRKDGNYRKPYEKYPEDNKED